MRFYLHMLQAFVLRCSAGTVRSVLLLSSQCPRGAAAALASEGW